MNRPIELQRGLLDEVFVEVNSYLNRNCLATEARIYVHPLVFEFLRFEKCNDSAFPQQKVTHIAGVPIVEGYELAVVICAPSRFNAEIVKLEIINK